MISFTLWHKCCMPTIQTSSFHGYVDMFRWSSALHSIIYISLRNNCKRRQTSSPLNTTAQYASHDFLRRKSLFCSTKHRNNGSRRSPFSSCIGRRNSEINNSETADSKSIARTTWVAAWAEWCKAGNMNVLNCEWKTRITLIPLADTCQHNLARHLQFLRHCLCTVRCLQL